MITEKNTIKTITELTPQTKRELNTKQNRVALISIIAGAILAVIFFALFVLDVAPEYEAAVLGMFALGLMLAAIGAIAKYSINKSIKLETSKQFYECEIYATGIAAKTIENGKTIHASLYDNSKVVRATETPNYYFLYVESLRAVPIAKADLLPIEIETIKATYFKQYVSAIDRLTLATFDPGEPDFVKSPTTDIFG